MVQTELLEMKTVTSKMKNTLGKIYSRIGIAEVKITQ